MTIFIWLGLPNQKWTVKTKKRLLKKQHHCQMNQRNFKVKNEHQKWLNILFQLPVVHLKVQKNIKCKSFYSIYLFNYLFIQLFIYSFIMCLDLLLHLILIKRLTTEYINYLVLFYFLDCSYQIFQEQLLIILKFKYEVK